MKIQNPIPILAAVAMAIPFSFASAQTQPAPAPAPAIPAIPAVPASAPTDVIMTVDGTPITQADFQERFLARFAAQFQQMTPEQRDQARPQVQQVIVGELVQQALLANAAEKKEIKVTDEEINKALARITEALPEGMSFEEYAKSAGMSVDRIRSQIAKEVKINKLLDEVTADITKPTDEQTRKFYTENTDRFAQPDSVSARHILISTKDISDETVLAAKKAQAESIRAELIAQKGENFAEVAKAKSEGPSGPRGGDLGEFKRGQMVPEFEQAAFSQDVGAIGEIVKTDFGYHIIQVQVKKEAKQRTFDEVKEEIYAGLLNQEKGLKIRSYLEGLQSAAEITEPGATSPAKPAPAAQ